MKLSEIIKEIEVLEVKGSTSVEINEVDIDSRKAGEGHLFVAVVGTAADGHDYIPGAVKAGVSAVICERFPETMPENVTFVRVKNSGDIVGQVDIELFPGIFQIPFQCHFFSRNIGKVYDTLTASAQLFFDRSSCTVVELNLLTYT